MVVAWSMVLLWAYRHVRPRCHSYRPPYCKVEKVFSPAGLFVSASHGPTMFHEGWLQRISKLGLWSYSSSTYAYFYTASWKSEIARLGPFGATCVRIKVARRTLCHCRQWRAERKITPTARPREDRINPELPAEP